MDTAVQVLDTYRGRDKVIRTCGYTIQLIAGLLPKEHQAFADALIGTASTLSGSRVVLRLCDDIPMLAYNLGYGLGGHEKDQFIRWVDVVKNMVDQFYGPVEHVMWATERQLLPGAYTEKLKEWCTKIWAISLTLNILRFLRWLGVANNALDQLYYPVEHVAWAAERQILPPSLRGLSQWCLKIWACSLTLNILRSLRALIILRLKKKRLAKTKQMEENDEADIKESMKTLRLQEFNVWLTLVGSSTDLVNAINWMPPGFLWAGKNPLALTGVMGMISSSIGLYRVYASKVKQA